MLLLARLGQAGQPGTGRQWLACFHLVETLTQSSEVSLPNLLSSLWWVATMQPHASKFPWPFGVHFLQTHTLLPNRSLLNPGELPYEGKHANSLQKQEQLNCFAHQLES